MLRFLPLLVLALVGLGSGLAAGYFLRPVPEEAAEHASEPAVPEHEPEYVKLSNQFIVPVVENGRVGAIVILALGLEVVSGATEAVQAKEPRLRDEILQVLFDHANAGGFRGSFTDGSNLILLRRALKEAAQKTIPDKVLDVLIVDIARQDS